MGRLQTKHIAVMVLKWNELGEMHNFNEMYESVYECKYLYREYCKVLN